MRDLPKIHTNGKLNNANIFIQYITEAGANLKASRVFWLTLVVAFACIGIHWSLEVVGKVGLRNQNKD